MYRNFQWNVCKVIELVTKTVSDFNLLICDNIFNIYVESVQYMCVSRWKLQGKTYIEGSIFLFNLCC